MLRALAGRDRRRRSAPTRAAYREADGAARARRRRAARRLLGPARACRATRSLLARFGAARAALAPALAALALPGRARAGAVRRPGRALDPAARARRSARRSAWCSRAPGTPSAGRSRAAARSDRRRAGRATCARSAARSRPAAASTSLDELPPARAVLLDVTPRQLLALAGDRLPGALPPPARALPLRPGRLQARLGARRPDPVDGAPSAARAGTVHLGGTLEEIAAAERAAAARRARRAAVRAARAAEPVRPDARAGRASTPPGPTATCRTARRADMTARDRGADRALRARASATSSLARARDGHAPTIERAQRELRRRRHQRRRAGPAAALHAAGRARPIPYTTPAPRRLPLLVVDAAGRRRARHVRLLGGAGGAEGAARD